MRQTVRKLSIVFAVLVLVGVATSEASAQVRPFRFKLDGVSDLTTGCIVSSVGEATHYGRFTIEGCVPIVGPFIGGIAPFAGSVTSIVANGDMVFGNIVGTIDINSVPYVADGTITVTGGTGRFVGASGSSSVHQLVNPTDGSFVSSGSGTISY